MKFTLSDLTSKINEKNRYWLLGGFLLLIFLADYFLIMKGQLTTLNNINPKLMLLKQDIALAKDHITRSPTYQTEVDRLNDKIENSSVKILSQEEIPNILEGISRIAEKNKIKIEQLTPVKGSQEMVLENTDGKYYSFPLMIEAKGGYHAIGHFIDQLEKDPVFKSISSLRIAGSADDTSRHSLKITIKTIVLEKPE